MLKRAGEWEEGQGGVGDGAAGEVVVGTISNNNYFFQMESTPTFKK